MVSEFHSEPIGARGTIVKYYLSGEIGCGFLGFFSLFCRFILISYYLSSVPTRTTECVFWHEDCYISVILLWVVSQITPYVHSPWHDANKCMVEWSTYHLFLQSQKEMAAKIRKLPAVLFFVACAIFVPQESAGDLLDPTLIGREVQSFANDALGGDDLQVRSHLC